MQMSPLKSDANANALCEWTLKCYMINIQILIIIIPSPQLKTSPSAVNDSVCPSDPFDDDIFFIMRLESNDSIFGTSWLFESPSPRRP